MKEDNKQINSDVFSEFTQQYQLRQAEVINVMYTELEDLHSQMIKLEKRISAANAYLERNGMDIKF